jgi:hypothetical protein
MVAVALLIAAVIHGFAWWLRSLHRELATVLGVLTAASVVLWLPVLGTVVFQFGFLPLLLLVIGLYQARVMKWSYLQGAFGCILTLGLWILFRIGIHSFLFSLLRNDGIDRKLYDSLADWNNSLVIPAAIVALEIIRPLRKSIRASLVSPLRKTP